MALSIHLEQDAYNKIKANKLKNGDAGIFEDKSGSIPTFVWYRFEDDTLDVGEEDTFDKAWRKLVEFR